MAWTSAELARIKKIEARLKVIEDYLKLIAATDSNPATNPSNSPGQ